MTQSRPYHRAEVEQILTAYRTLFPEATALATYWDFGRKRPWSCLTTDFHRATPESVAAFDESVRKLAIAQTDPLSRGEALRDLSLAHGVGYSLGISPWTDDLLLRTFTPRTKRVILVLGHDWYPIVTADLGYQATPPLDRFSVFDEPKYGEAVLSSLWADGETGLMEVLIRVNTGFSPNCSGKLSKTRFTGDQDVENRFRFPGGLRTSTCSGGRGPTRLSSRSPGNHRSSVQLCSPRSRRKRDPAIREGPGMTAPKNVAFKELCTG